MLPWKFEYRTKTIGNEFRQRTVVDGMNMPEDTQHLGGRFVLLESKQVTFRMVVCIQDFFKSWISQYDAPHFRQFDKQNFSVWRLCGCSIRENSIENIQEKTDDRARPFINKSHQVNVHGGLTVLLLLGSRGGGARKTILSAIWLVLN